MGQAEEEGLAGCASLENEGLALGTCLEICAQPCPGAGLWYPGNW